jgi:hypothetical protein
VAFDTALHQQRGHEHQNLSDVEPDLDKEGPHKTSASAPENQTHKRKQDY